MVFKEFIEHWPNKLLQVFTNGTGDFRKMIQFQIHKTAIRSIR